MTSLGGPFADRTALNATVTGTIERNGYRIEKVIFESQPKFFVTANLYVPTRGAGPFPAILFPLGHESGAKAHEAWQRVLANLAMRGFVLLAWDPIGQGERIQMWDEDFLTSKLVASTTEHTMQGIQTLLVGEGISANESYLWLLDANDRPRAWRMWVSVIPIGGLEATWEGWTQLPTGAWVSTLHHVGPVTMQLKDVAGAETLSSLVPGGDPFAPLFAR